MNANEPWPRNKIFCLISSYRSKTCLWNKSNNAYTDRDKRNAAWEEVSWEVGVDVRTAERKMKSLKTQFFHYYKLTLKDQNEPYVPKWFAYQALHFLVENRLPKCTIEENAQLKEAEQIKQETCRSYDDCDDTLPSPNVEAEAQIEGPSSPSPQQFSPIPPALRPTKYSQYCDSPLTHFDPSVEVAAKSSSTAERRDEFTIFTEYIADRLRRLPDAKSRLIAKHKIHNALFEVELETVETRTSVQSQSSRFQKSNVTLPSSSGASPFVSHSEVE